MNNITTIKISKETRERLARLKEYERETFNEVLNKLFYVLNVCRKEPEKAKKILISLDHKQKRKEILKGKTLKSETEKINSE